MNPIDPDLLIRVQTLFGKLSPNNFPAPASLTKLLNDNVPAGTVQQLPLDVSILPAEAALFMTASVEMWQRAIHSFLYSAALPRVSPIWSAVSGYYSSHYSMRAFAHLLGHFQLFSKKRSVEFSIQGGQYVCTYKPKGSQGDHRFYWKVVKQDPYFVSDPLFTLNDENQPDSDSSHRGRANYADHLNQFSGFELPQQTDLITRIRQISTIQFSDPPIPNRERYPDLDSVQVVAYHRIVKFRRFLDEILGGTNRFWTQQRKPLWVRDLMDFQLVEQDSLRAFG